MKLKLNNLLVSKDVNANFTAEAYVLMVWHRGWLVCCNFISHQFYF